MYSLGGGGEVISEGCLIPENALSMAVSWQRPHPIFAAEVNRYKTLRGQLGQNEANDSNTGTQS